jgi:hypothetical protein
MKGLLLLFLLHIACSDLIINSGVVPGVYHAGLFTINAGGQVTAATDGIPFNDTRVYSDITAAGGTTILSTSSPIYHRVIGNNAQNIRLPVSDGLARVYTAINGATVGINNFIIVQSGLVTPIRAVSSRGSTKVAVGPLNVNQPFAVFATFIGTDYSTLTGQGTTGFTSYGFFSVSSGAGSLALGWCTASGQGSMCAMANDGVGLVSATGLRSIAMGNGVTSSAQDAICMGQYLTCASAADSVYIGHGAGFTSSGLTIGSWSTASGSGSSTFGYSITSSATRCVGIGQSLTCSGSGSVAMAGSATAATSVALGGTLNGVSSVALGGNINSTQSITVGPTALAAATLSTVIGTNAVSSIPSGIALGQLATPFSASFALAITTNAASHVPAGLGVTLDGQPAFIEAYGGSFSKTAVSGGTTTLVAASSQYQLFTGTGTQTVVLPNTASLRNGFTFYIMNLASGSLTIQDSSLSTITTLTSGVLPIATWVGAMVASGSWILVK